MFSNMRKHVIVFVCVWTLSLVGADIYGVGTESNVSSCAVDHKLKTFAVLAQKLFAKYKQDPKAVINSLEAVNSNCCVHIIDSCSKPQFLELSRFKLKNKKLFKKLGCILLAILSEIAVDTLKRLEFSEDNIADVQHMIENINTDFDDFSIHETLSAAKSKENNDNINRIMGKINPLLDQVLGENIGISAENLKNIKNKFEAGMARALNYDDVKELCKFVTKQNGAFGVIVDEIDTLWMTLLNGLK